MSGLPLHRPTEIFNSTSNVTIDLLLKSNHTSFLKIKQLLKRNKQKSTIYNSSQIGQNQLRNKPIALPHGFPPPPIPRRYGPCGASHHLWWLGIPSCRSSVNMHRSGSLVEAALEICFPSAVKAIICIFTSYWLSLVCTWSWIIHDIDVLARSLWWCHCFCKAYILLSSSYTRIQENLLFLHHKEKGTLAFTLLIKVLRCLFYSYR